MIYKKEVIEQLASYFREEAAGYNWLKENNLNELLFLKPALLDDERALGWLLNNKHTVLAAFVKAVRDDKDALQWLLRNKMAIWAATSNAINKDAGADRWLKLNGYAHYSKLAENIQEFFKKNEADDLDNILKGPIR